MFNKNQHFTGRSCRAKSNKDGSNNPCSDFKMCAWIYVKKYFYVVYCHRPLSLQELREIHNKQQLQKQKNVEADRLKQKEQERKTEPEKLKDSQR